MRNRRPVRQPVRRLRPRRPAAPALGVGPSVTASRARTGTATPDVLVAVPPLTAGRGRAGWCVPSLTDGVTVRVRWRLDDPTDGHSWVFETNPSDGGSPHYKRNVTVTPTTAADGTPLYFQGDDDLPTSSFTVITRTQGAYDILVDWYRRCRTHPLLLTDDLGRRTYIVFSTTKPARKQAARRPWKHEWAVNYYIWQELD